MKKQELIKEIWPYINRDSGIYFEICRFGREYDLEEFIGAGGWYSVYNKEPDSRIYIRCAEGQFANRRELAAWIKQEELIYKQKRDDR